MIKILLGHELGEKQEEIQRIKNQFFSDDKYEKYIFLASTDSIEDMMDVFDTVSMFDEKKYVLFYNFELVKKEKELSRIIKKIKEKSSDYLGILLSDENKHPILKSLEKNNDNYKIFYEYNESKKTKLIMDIFSKNHFSISYADAVFLASNLNNESLIIRSECSKLMFYKKESKIISYSDICNLIESSKQENAFSIFPYICQKDLQKCLLGVSNLNISSQEAITFVAGILWNFQKCFSLSKIAAKSGIENAFKSEGIFIKIQQENFSAMMNKYTKTEIQNAILRLNSINLLIRTQPNFVKFFLEMFFLETILDKKDSFFMKEKPKLFT